MKRPAEIYIENPDEARQRVEDAGLFADIPISVLKLMIGQNWRLQVQASLQNTPNRLTFVDIIAFLLSDPRLKRAIYDDDEFWKSLFYSRDTYFKRFGLDYLEDDLRVFGFRRKFLFQERFSAQKIKRLEEYVLAFTFNVLVAKEHKISISGNLVRNTAVSSVYVIVFKTATYPSGPFLQLVNRIYQIFIQLYQQHHIAMRHFGPRIETQDENRLGILIPILGNIPISEFNRIIYDFVIETFNSPDIFFGNSFQSFDDTTRYVSCRVCNVNEAKYRCCSVAAYCSQECQQADTRGEHAENEHEFRLY